MVKLELVAYIKSLGEMIGGARMRVVKALDVWYESGISPEDVLFAANVTMEEAQECFKYQIQIDNEKMVELANVKTGEVIATIKGNLVTTIDGRVYDVSREDIAWLVSKDNVTVDDIRLVGFSVGRN